MSIDWTMDQSKSQKFLPKEDITQTGAHIGLAAEVSSIFIHILEQQTNRIHPINRYSADDAVGDLVAGITVGLTVIPQALAYSGIAGLPPAVSAREFNIAPIVQFINNHFLIFSMAFTVHSWDASFTSFWGQAKMCRWDQRRSLRCSHSRPLAVSGNVLFFYHFWRAPLKCWWEYWA